MTIVAEAAGPAQAALASAITAATSTVAPSWPLDRQIAVNPYWGFIGHRFAVAAAELERLADSRLTFAPEEYLRAWHAGEITRDALGRALAESGLSSTIERAIDALRTPRPPSSGMVLLSDLLDERTRPGLAPRWRDAITQQVSQFCGSYFDEHQADWRRGRRSGLFAAWRRSLGADHALEALMHAPAIRSRIRELPGTADAAIAWSLERLGIPIERASDFLQVCLLRINGWASWCAYLGWEAGLAGSGDAHLRELLAVRVSWEVLLLDDDREVGSPAARLHAHWTAKPPGARSPHLEWDLVWQRAHEITYQDGLIRQFDPDRGAEASVGAELRRDAQLVFCIDVRSERFRRALEELDPAIETRGFAGFFGLPIRYTPLGTGNPRAQLPGLLAPQLEATESTGDARVDDSIAHRRARQLDARSGWQHFQRMPSGSFSLVETVGIAYVGAILRRHFGSDASAPGLPGASVLDRRGLRPMLAFPEAGSAARKADIVAPILRAMSFTGSFARLVVLVGHGSQSANNPQSAALDCGACGGHTGEVNARVLAGLLNDRAVREELRRRRIDIPEDSVVVAALHNTTTDEVTLLDSEALPDSHRPDAQRLQRGLLEAGHRTRAERAPSLGMGALAGRPDLLLQRMRRRGRDWAETRPEWGLAGNAAFIVAPRSRTSGVNLAGRAFLHDYSWTEDRDGAVLDLVMTAPMLVTHWINMQYHASTVDPVRFGSGNKLLHNVVCGHIGVFEGNTGDLRVGLARQSVHDGERWMHAPLRLSVFIDAPRAMIEAVIARHATVRQLVEHGWLHLFRFAATGIEQRRDGEWARWDGMNGTPAAAVA